MITIKNYQDQKNAVTWSKMPKSVQDTRSDIEDMMEFYDEDAELKELVDIFLKQINDNSKPVGDIIAAKLPKIDFVEPEKRPAVPLFLRNDVVKLKPSAKTENPYMFDKYGSTNFVVTSVLTTSKGDMIPGQKNIVKTVKYTYVVLPEGSKNTEHIDEEDLDHVRNANALTNQKPKKETIQDAFLDARLTRSLMPKRQQMAVLENDESEELQYFIDKVKEFEKIFKKIESERQNNASIQESTVYAHYFYGESHWFVTEYHDKEDEFFGYVVLNGDTQMSEAGYISVPEILSIKGIELDFSFTPKNLGKELKTRYPGEYGDDEDEASGVTNQKYGKKYVIAVLKDLGTDREATKRATKNLDSNTIKEIRAELIKDNFSGEYLDKTVIPKIKAEPSTEVMPKVTMVEKAKIKKVIDKTIVDNLSPEFLLIRRFWNLIKKENISVPFRTVQLLYMAFNKAAVERKVRKTSEAAELFTKCNKKIITLFEDFPNLDKKPFEIEFTDKSLHKQIQEYVTDVAVNPAIPVLKRFIAIQNTKPDPKKVTAMIKSIDKIIKDGSQNRLRSELLDAKSALELYATGGVKKLKPEYFGLSVPRIVCTNRIKCAGIDKTGKLHKGYRFQEHTGNIIKVRKGKLASPNVCENRVKCSGLSKTGKLLPGYKFEEGTNHVIKVRKTAKKVAKKPTVKKKVVAGLGYSDNLEFTGVQRIYTSSPVIPVVASQAILNEGDFDTSEQETATLGRTIPVQEEKPVKNKLMNMQFDSLDLDEGWENFMQNPAKNMKVAIWGAPKNGKTAGSLQFANYLTKFGNVLYNFADQGFNKSTQDLWKQSGLSSNTKAEPSDTQTLADLEKEIATGKYTFVFIDMISDYINKENIKPYEFKERFMKKYPKVSFILIFEVTKGGNFKGDQGWTHIVDAIVTVENFLMENRGRYGVGSHIVWEDGLKRFDPKKYDEVMEELQPEPTLEFTEVERI